MDKIYQVFVSSTFEDLQEERKEVMQALLELDCMPAGMELFPASNDDQWTLIKRVIDACDYYLLIIGGRYGSTNEHGISYTQMEFEYALETGKPIISFLHKKPGDIPASKFEQDPEKRTKLDTFRELAQKKLVRYWETPAELGSTVSRSMIKLIKDFPAEGWVRAGSAVDEKSVKEIARLQKENSDLKEKLASVAVEAPKGSDMLSQGEDELVLNYQVKAWHAKKSNYYILRDEIVCTWNELFTAVAPYLINECTEFKMLNAIKSFVEENATETIKAYRGQGYNQFNNLEIDTNDYNVVKVQFRALGLISLSEKKRQVSDKNTYWKLTLYGDYIMTQLLAIRK